MLDYRSFPIRIPATPRNEARLTRSPPRLFTAAPLVALTAAAHKASSLPGRYLHKRSEQTEVCEGAVDQKMKFIQIFICLFLHTTQTCDTVGPMFDA